MKKLTPFLLILTTTFSCVENVSDVNTNQISSCAYDSDYVPDYLVNRLENEVVNLEYIDDVKNYKNIQNSVIFIGSSTITYWNKTIDSDFPNFPAIGHGIGGSTFPEQIYFRERLVTRFLPKTVVIYCENDIFGSKYKTEEQVLNDACRLIQDIHSISPKSKIFLLSLKHSPSRRNAIPRMNKINQLFKSYCANKSYMSYIDINPAMYKSDQKTLDGSIFKSDSLHMNRKGYERWISIIKPILEADYKSR